MLRCARSAHLRPRAFACRFGVVNSVQRHPGRARHVSTTAKHGRAAHQLPAHLASLSERLDEIAPSFDVEPDAIEIIESPARFYALLKAKILAARSRIYLSTLYIGTAEHELIDTIRDSLQINPDLKVSFLCDALRGTREAPNATTASLLAPLVKEFGENRVEIRLFHTPNLSGIRKYFIPRRFNEGWGLQHMKLYGFDDEVILSGANLSKDYFTNRVDRYHLFRSVDLADHYHRLHEAVCEMSFDIQPSDEQCGYTMAWPDGRDIPSPIENPELFKRHASERVAQLLGPSASARHDKARKHGSTRVYPIVQVTPLSPAGDHADKSTEVPALTKTLLHLRQSPVSIVFTAGYFNPSPTLVSLLLSSHAAAQATIIAASAQANGFYGSKGVSGLLPAAYTLLFKRFLQAAQRSGMDRRITFLEWRRGTANVADGWTYHAKGIWVTLTADGKPDCGPSVTCIGSSNYTARSNSLDLEANALVLTSDDGLRSRLQVEIDRFKEHTEAVTLDDFSRTERRVGLHVRLAMWITRLVGGAL